MNRKDLIVYRNWSKVNESLIQFERKADFETFKYMYGEDGERLWNHFIVDCKYKFQQFLTYLTLERQNELIINAHENPEMYYKRV